VEVNQGLLTERLFNLFACCQEAEVYKGSDGNSQDRVPSEIFGKLDGQEKEVEPDSAIQKY
jgi:hypothetical protein